MKLDFTVEQARRLTDELCYLDIFDDTPSVLALYDALIDFQEDSAPTFAFYDGVSATATEIAHMYHVGQKDEADEAYAAACERWSDLSISLYHSIMVQVEDLKKAEIDDAIRTLRAEPGV